MKTYNGSCHCGSVKFSFDAEVILNGLRCNCSICQRKGATMSEFTIAKAAFSINAEPDSLKTYEFGSCVAKHHFCQRCGIYTFHQTMRKAEHYRVNLGCLDGVDAVSLPYEVFDGASI